MPHQYAFLFPCNKVDHPLVLYKYLGLETTREEAPSQLPVPHVSKPSGQRKDSFRVKFLVLFYVLTIYLGRYLRVNALLCNVSLPPDGEKKHSMQFQERRSYVHAPHHTPTNHHNRTQAISTQTITNAMPKLCGASIIPYPCYYCKA